MRQKSVANRRRPSVEDPGGYDELPRTPEIKAYAAATRQLFRRSLLFRLFSLATGGYIVWVLTYVVGISGVGPVANDHERHVALLVSIGWLASICFVVVPFMVMIYRGRLFRVSVKQGQSRPPSRPFDQDAS